MRIVIDISKDRYDAIMSLDWKNCRLLFDEEIRAIHDGKALEQETCADMVSRDAMWDVLQRLYGTEGELVEELMSLPPVLPMPKMGRWITWKEAGNDIPSETRFECSVCHYAAQTLCNGLDLLSDYCPNCGANMSEIPTGSEGSEKND